MKSAIDWLLGKTIPITENSNESIITSGLLNSDSEACNINSPSTRANTILNGQYNDLPNRQRIVQPYPENMDRPRRPSGEDFKSPWGRTLTPKGLKESPGNKTLSLGKTNSSPSRYKSPKSWEDISFASDVTSPGFTTRIAKEARNRKSYDGSRKYPIGQERYIQSGVLPNVRLKGKIKPIVKARRAPIPLMPLAPSTSPFSSSFMSSASTRMPDISSVVSVLDSPPTLSINESVRDPTSVQAVVAALDKAQNLKSGVKRSRYIDQGDSNKKQKCASNTNQVNIMYTPPSSQVSTTGEKRALDLSPPNSSDNFHNDSSQLSPENKRRCIPDPRIASFSSSKVVGNNNMLKFKLSGRESPFSVYDSQQDSDSESNKSLESHQSRHSYRAQENDDVLVSNGGLTHTDNFDRSGSQTPQSLKGSYCISGFSNGSSSSSRTTTPSRPSHSFSIEAYKADKAKSQQRLNKMLGMLFNVTDDEVQTSLQSLKMNGSTNSLPSLPFGSEATLPTINPQPVVNFSSTQEKPSLDPIPEKTEESNDVSASFTLNLKPIVSSPSVSVSQPSTTVSVANGNLSVSSTKEDNSKHSQLTELLSRGQTITFNSGEKSKVVGQVAENNSPANSKTIEKLTSPVSSVQQPILTPSNTHIVTPIKPFSFGASSTPSSSLQSSSESSIPTVVSNPLVTSGVINIQNSILSKPAISTSDSVIKSSTSELFNFGIGSSKNDVSSSFGTVVPSQSITTEPAPTFSLGFADSTKFSNFPTSSTSTNLSFASSQLFNTSPQFTFKTTAESSISATVSSVAPITTSLNNKSNGIETAKMTTTSIAFGNVNGSIFSFGSTSNNSLDKPVVSSSTLLPYSSIETGKTTQSSFPMFSFGSTSNTTPTTASTGFESLKPATQPTFNFKPTIETSNVDLKFVSTTPALSSVSPFTFNTSTPSSKPVFGSNGGGFTFSPKVSFSELKSTSNKTTTTTSSTVSKPFSFVQPSVPSSKSIFDFPSTPNSASNINFTSSPPTSSLFTFESSTTSSSGGGIFGVSSAVTTNSASTFGMTSPFQTQSVDKASNKGIFSSSAVTTQSTIFGSPTSVTTTTASSSFGSSNMFAPNPNSNSLFGSSFGSSEKTDGFNQPTPSAFGSGSATSFGGSTTPFGSTTAFGSNSTAQPLTFGSPSNNAPIFGASNNAPTFGSPNQSNQTFAAKPTTAFGATSSAFDSGSNSFNFGQSTPANNPSSTFSFGQAAQPNSSNAFSFGQSASSPQQGIFQFGSAAPSPVPNFNAGTPGDTSSSVSRRPKARAYRRR